MATLRISQCLELVWSDAGPAINQKIISAFDRLNQDAVSRRSHFFAGRYENIYLDRAAIPELEPVLLLALASAERILGRSQLKMGFWFNEMQPGQRTTRHSHDDDDELLSAVYYLKVPENSGRLHLIQGPISTLVEPEEGMFAFFAPSLEHEVEENRGGEPRLSLAMNFGPAS